MKKIDENTISTKIGKHVELEIDDKENTAWRLMMQIGRFFILPVVLFKKYYAESKLSKSSKFYNLVNYRLSDFLFEKTIQAVVVLGLFGLGLYAFEFDTNSIIIAMSLIALILFTPSLFKILFIALVMAIDLAVRIIRSIVITLKILFTLDG